MVAANAARFKPNVLVPFEIVVMVIVRYFN